MEWIKKDESAANLQLKVKYGPPPIFFRKFKMMLEMGTEKLYIIFLIPWSSVIILKTSSTCACFVLHAMQTVGRVPFYTPFYTHVYRSPPFCGTHVYRNPLFCGTHVYRSPPFCFTHVYRSPPCVPLLNYTKKKYSRTLILLSSSFLIIPHHMCAWKFQVISPTHAVRCATLIILILIIPTV